jgi:hypothetical protein
MLAVHGYFLTAITFHVCVVIGLISFALTDTESNKLIGLRTPRTLRNPEDWRRANAQVAKIMPLLSAVCAVISLCGIWIGALRTGLAFLIIVGVQVFTLIWLAAVWWAEPYE